MDILIKISDTLRSFHEYVDVRQVDRGRVINEYKMTLHDFVEAIKSSTTQSHIEEPVFETPILPSNCIKYLETTSKKIICIDVPANQWETIYADKTGLMGYPRMIFRYEVIEDRVTNLSVVSVEKGKVTDESKVYFCPTPNVYSNGKICLGMNRFPKITSLNDLRTFHNIFFSAPFTNEVGFRVNGINSFREVFTKFENKNFDESLLIPMQNYTFKDFAAGIS